MEELDSLKTGAKGPGKTGTKDLRSVEGESSPSGSPNMSSSSIMRYCGSLDVVIFQQKLCCAYRQPCLVVERRV